MIARVDTPPSIEVPAGGYAALPTKGRFGDPRRRMPCRARGQFVAFDQNDIRPAFLRQVIQGRATGNAATDHDDTVWVFMALSLFVGGIGRGRTRRINQRQTGSAKAKAIVISPERDVCRLPPQAPCLRNGTRTRGQDGRRACLTPQGWAGRQSGQARPAARGQSLPARPARRAEQAIVETGPDLTPVWAEEAAVLALIKAVERGDVGAAAHAEMARLAAEMAARSDHILVACTELSLLTGSIATPFTDSLNCLVQAILDFARG